MSPQIREFVSVPTSIDFISAISQQLAVQGAPIFISYKVRLKQNLMQVIDPRIGDNINCPN